MVYKLQTIKPISTTKFAFVIRDYDPETGRWVSKDPIGFNGGTPTIFMAIVLMIQVTSLQKTKLPK